MKCKIELPSKSHEKRPPLKFKGRWYCKQETQIKQNPKFIRKRRRKSGQSKQGKKLNFNFFCLQLSLFGRLMKTLISQYSTKCAWNSFLLCSTRQFVNKIRKIKIPDESLQQMLILCWRPFQWWHLSLLGTGSPKTIFQQYLFSGLHKIFFKAN